MEEGGREGSQEVRQKGVKGRRKIMRSEHIYVYIYVYEGRMKRRREPESEVEEGEKGNMKRMPKLSQKEYG